MSQVMVPEMEKQGYDKTFAAGLTVYGGMLWPIIPPSVMFVVYSVLAQVAVGDMLIAGILPGVLLTVLFFVVIALMGFVYNYPRSEKRTLAQRARTVVQASPTLLIPIIIVGSILSGLANPTESAAVVQTVAHDPVTFLLLTNVILLVIGTVIDGIPGLIMTAPILLPIATEVYHIDPRHFGVVIVVNLVLGLMTPPVGLSFFVASAV